MPKYSFIALIVLALFVSSCQPQTTEQPPAAVEIGEIVKADPALDSIVPASAKIEKLAGGFRFTEGPVWIQPGYLLFSDIPASSIVKWAPGGGVSLFRAPIGSNGLTLDSEGRLVICGHTDRSISRFEKDGSMTVLADRYKGKRLSSPNDLVYKSDGSLYFTDPPYGLEKEDDDPEKEVEFNGIYRLSGSKLQLVHKGMNRPNGLAFSPDENYLYVANSDPAKSLWMRFEVQPDGSLANDTVFYDVTQETEEGLPDGMKVDKKGNLYCTGPGGVWIFSPDGKHLGTIKPPEVPANCAWGGSDGKTLYITAQTGLYRIRLEAEGVRP